MHTKIFPRTKGNRISSIFERPFWTATLMLMMIVFPASCSPKKTVETAAQTELVPAPAAQATTDSSPSPHAAMEKREAEVWSRLLNKQSCNLLHGCPPAEELVGLGAEVAARSAARLKADKGDRIWRFALARALVGLRNPQVQQWQTEALTHHQWLIRAYAAVGLGRNQPEQFRDRSEALLKKETHPGVQMGILWAMALARIKGARQRLTDHFSNLRASADIRVELLALDATRSLSLVEALPLVRRLLNHPNFFVVRDAVQTVQSLLDHQSIPLVIPLLSHERKLVRDVVLATLKRLTGLRNKRTRADFERWCKKYCDPSR